MKKPTLMLERLAFHLERVAQDVARLAKFDQKHEAYMFWVGDTPLYQQFFSYKEAGPAPARGREQRRRVRVGWVWFAGVMSDVNGAALIRKLLFEIPGVVDVSAPTKDTQFGTFTGVEIIIRTRQ